MISYQEIRSKEVFIYRNLICRKESCTAVIIARKFNHGIFGLGKRNTVIIQPDTMVIPLSDKFEV